MCIICSKLFANAVHASDINFADQNYSQQCRHNFTVTAHVKCYFICVGRKRKYKLSLKKKETKSTKFLKKKLYIFIGWTWF